MKKIFTLIATALLTLSANAQTSTVGAEDNSALWWTAFSDYYTVKKGEKAHITFKNYSSKAETYHNWILISTVADAERTSSNYKEYFAARPDNYGWGDYWDAASLKNDYNWDTFKEDMDGSSVAMDVSNRGGIIYGAATITTAANKTYNYTFNSTNISADNFTFFLTVEKSHITDLAVTIADTTTVWSANALVYLPGKDEEVQRTIEFKTDSTYVIKNMYGEGTSDVALKVDKTGHVDFANSTMDSSYYTWQKVTGSSDVTQLWAYAAYYYSYTLDNNGDYYTLPGKLGGELVISYTGAYNGQDAVGTNNKTLYVCWGKTRLAGTKDCAGKATLVGTPAVEGVVDGNWATTDKASIGFYYDELKGDTVYRVNNWYGADKYFHFRATDAGQLSYTSQYIYTGDATVNYVYAYDGQYSYTYGDNNYYIKDLTKVRNGEIGFFAYAYNADNKYINYYSADWTKNYYIFDWENSDIASGINAISSVNEEVSAYKCLKNGKLVILKNGREYNAAGALLK